MEAAALASLTMGELGGDIRRARFLLAACGGGGEGREGGREEEGEGETMGDRLRQALTAFADPPPPPLAVYPSLPPSLPAAPHLVIIVKDPVTSLLLAQRAVAAGLRVTGARNPCHVLSEVIDQDETFFHAMVLEVDFPVISGLEAAMRFRALPSPRVGEGGREGGREGGLQARAKLMMVMVVNGSPHANYSGTFPSLPPSLPPSLHVYFHTYPPPLPPSLPPSLPRLRSTRLDCRD